MKAALRERIIERMLLIPPLIDQYVQQQYSFVENTLIWLKNNEQAIASTRSPLIAQFSALRGQLIAIDDGLLNDNIQTGRSIRKNRRALAAHIITIADQALRDELANIDQYFEELKDKLSQLIAIVSAKEQLPFCAVITTEYLDRLWLLLQQHEETKSMSIYIKTRTDSVDRHYLLQELLKNLFDK